MHSASAQAGSQSSIADMGVCDARRASYAAADSSFAAETFAADLAAGRRAIAGERLAQHWLSPHTRRTAQPPNHTAPTAALSRSPQPQPSAATLHHAARPCHAGAYAVFPGSINALSLFLFFRLDAVSKLLDYQQAANVVVVVVVAVFVVVVVEAVDAAVAVAVAVA